MTNSTKIISPSGQLQNSKFLLIVVVERFTSRKICYLRSKNIPNTTIVKSLPAWQEPKMFSTTVTTTLIRRSFGTRTVKWLQTSAFSPPKTVSGVFAPISRHRPRSLTTATHARASAALIGNGGGTLTFVDGGDRVSSYRYLSLRRYSNTQTTNKRFNLRALPFSISPEEALESFRKWAEDDQGLKYLMNYNSIRIGAAYVPVWSFDLNIRFKQQEKRSNPYSWKPPIFEGYDRSGRQDVIYLPGGLAAYAGYSYRRSLINPVHSTTLIFMGNQTEPFGAWMLKDMQLKDTGFPVHVVPDAWNSTQARAFAVVKEELQEIVDGDWTDSDTPPPFVQTQVVSARRVFMPTFVIEYKILGLEYQAFVSGCDTSAPVGGVSHQIFEDGSELGGLSPEFQRSSRNLLVSLSSGASRLLQTFNLPVLLTIFRPLFSVIWFALVRIATLTPVIGIAGGLFAGFRKVLQPWMDSRKASAEWERQRQREAEMNEDDEEISQKFRMNDFNDVSGRAKSHFQRNRESILRSLAGEATHQEGDFNWYSDWQGTLKVLQTWALLNQVMEFVMVLFGITRPLTRCCIWNRFFLFQHGRNSSGSSRRVNSSSSNNIITINNSSSSNNNINSIISVDSSQGPMQRRMNLNGLSIQTTPTLCWASNEMSRIRRFRMPFERKC